MEQNLSITATNKSFSLADILENGIFEMQVIVDDDLILFVLFTLRLIEMLLLNIKERLLQNERMKYMLCFCIYILALIIGNINIYINRYQIIQRCEFGVIFKQYGLCLNHNLYY